MRRKTHAINKTKFLLEPELLQLRAAITRNQGSRDATLLAFLLFTGARVSEALAVTLEDLNPHDQSVLIRGLKGSNDRELPLPPELFNALARRKTQGRVFAITARRARQVWDLWRPVRKKLHALRHTFAIELFKRTRDLRLVQVALGHRNIQNTIVYAEYVYSVEELRTKIQAVW
jgi:site-specific recombinase XerD